MRYLRCVVARWLRRQADRLDPPQEPVFRLTADAYDPRRRHYAGYVGPDVTPSESGVALTFTDSLPRRPDPPPPQPNRSVVTGPEKRSPS